MGFPRRRRGWLATAIAICAFAGTPGAATAAEYNYCGWLVDPDTWCWDENNTYRDYVENIAHYHGDGTVRVCARFWSYWAGAYNKVCGYNSARTTRCKCGSIRADSANASSNRHTIWGHAYT